MKNLEEIKNEIIDLKETIESYGLEYQLIESDVDCRFVIEKQPYKFFNAYIVSYKYDNESIYVRCFIVTNQLNCLETKSRTIYGSCWDSVKSQESLQDHIIAFCNRYSILYYHFADIQDRMRDIDRICDDQKLPKIVFNFE